MRDNVSIIIAAIVGGILVVLMPLISILERQDNMTYNVALTLTTNFVDEIRSKGFIDKKSYNDYMGKMAQTGCLYEYQIEAHKKIIIPVSDDDGNIITGKYEEDTLIQNKKDIEAVLYSTDTQDVKSSEKKEVYLFDEGDEFYIKVKNTNATSSSMLYKFISGQSNETVINVSYGGIINNINWELYTQTLELTDKKARQPDVTFSLPKNSSGETKYTTEDVYTAKETSPGVSEYFVTGKSYKYKFELKDDPTIKFDVTLRNFEKFYTSSGISNDLTVDCLLDYIAKNDFKGTISIEGLTKVNGAYRFTIVISDIITYSQIQDISISIKPGLGSGNGYNSSGYDSPIVTIVNDYSIHSVTLTGPYSSVTNKLIPSHQVFYKDANNFQDIYFLINYTSIDNDVDVITEAATNNFQIGYGGDSKKLSQATTDGIIKDNWNVSNTANAELKYGTIKVELAYIDKFSSFANGQENFAMIEPGWVTGAMNDGVDIGDAYGARIPNYSKYSVLKDTIAPEGRLKIYVKYPENDNEWGEALYNHAVSPIVYEIPNLSTEIQIDLSGITDIGTSSIWTGDTPGSGLCYIQLSNDNVTFSDKIIYTGQNIPWNIADTTPGEKKIYYKLIDYIGNESSVITQKIKVIKAGVPVQLFAQINGTSITATPEVWYNKDLKIITTVDDSDGWVSPASGYTLKLKNTRTGNQTTASSSVTPPAKLVTTQILGDSTNIVAGSDITDETGKTQFIATGESSGGYFSLVKTVMANYYVDKIKPRISIEGTIPTGWVKNVTNKVTIRELETESGINSIKIGVTDKSTIIDSDLTSRDIHTTNFPLAEYAYGGLGSIQPGETNIFIRATDNATNENTVSYHVKIDNEGPKITYTNSRCQQNYYNCR